MFKVKEGPVCKRRSCFAIRENILGDKYCSVLLDNQFGVNVPKPCPFYKSKAQVEKERQKEAEK